MFDEFFRKAHELRSAGTPFATAVVVRADKPTSGKPGDRAIVTADGTLYGWIGGSCAQPSVAREARRALEEGTARLIRLSNTPDAMPARDGVVDLPMTCYSGGTLEIFIEPHRPTPQLLVVGDLPVAQALAHLGRALSYRVVAVVPDGSEAMAHADQVSHRLEDLAGLVTPLTFAVVATHGEYDEDALSALLGGPAPYVGLVASRARGVQVRETLASRGLAEGVLDRIRFPAGLDIGARRGDEIAVSIIAEIVQTRRALGDVPVARVEEGAAAGAPAPATAVDPVCGMDVEIERARARHVHDDRTYYFCCPGCAARFVEDPGAFVSV